MPKKARAKRFKPTRKYVVVLCLALLIVSIFMYFIKVNYINKYDQAVQQSKIDSLRELTLKAVEEKNVTAPTDAPTGNVYFPEARLFVSNVPSISELSYSYTPATKTTIADFRVSSHALFNKNEVLMYEATTMKDLMSAIPKLESCQRGVQISYDKLDTSANDLLLKLTTNLGNGKTLYFYIEKSCPELSETVLELGSIQAY